METTQTAPETTQTPAAPETEPAPLWTGPKKRRKWIKHVLVIAAVLALLFWIVVRPMLGGTVAAAGAYQTAQVQRQDLTVSVSGSGTVTPIESYQVSALVTGEILESPFEDGDQVEKDQLLYRIDPGSAQTALQQAQLSVQQAQMNYDTLASSLQVKAIGGGVVQTLHVQEGDLVSAGTAIADITDTSTMTLTVPFQASDAAHISVGQTAQITLSGTLETLSGTVESVASADQVGNGGALVRQVKIRLTNPGALTDATTATARVGSYACAAGGTLSPRLRQTITAAASGEITNLNVSVGSRVSAGAVLAAIGGESAENSLADAALAVQNAQLSLQSAQEALDSYTITSPISGTVIEKNLKAGDQLNGGDSGAMAVIYDLSQLELQMDVSELDIGQIQPGQTVEITAEALPGQTFTGVVEKVSVNGTTTDGFTTYPVTILLSEYGDLNPGMNVSAHIIVERSENALCVPAEAVNSDGTVLVAGEGAFAEDGVTIADPSEIESRPVTLGRGNQDYVEITSGLEEGETVLLPIQSTGGMPSDGSAAVAAAG
ncbi:efflux RND transporter periplasmic adaptor subunit [Pseudoflavonifractor capillosus]|uniref:efflux RND transporter periplasmic adaptor subunit n=1 Tax=Pseudoflavonifractor capillosus TaxID=106588 RepID=UPI00195ECF3B|nr:efflux RND transporter periplasmic adaptor subunit [Pseudoflavonifractor capillosus]MBM6680952.1 efflux RND transporter periplasmic adaptor subunit [Pseudoflavonifractor capillosus]